jgi:hypothetical protein
VPFERPAQYGTRAFLTDEEYAKRLNDVRLRNAKISSALTSWRARSTHRMRPSRTGANTTRRHGRTSLIIDPPNGAFRRASRARSRGRFGRSVAQLAVGEPCDTYEDYGLGVRCIAHGEGVPDAMFPASTTRTCASCRARASSRSATS